MPDKRSGLLAPQEAAERKAEIEKLRTELQNDPNTDERICLYREGNKQAQTNDPVS